MLSSLEKRRMTFLILCVLWFPTFSGLLAQNETEGFIQEAVRSLLGVKDGSSETSGHAGRRLSEPPKYMLDLYDTYKKGEVPTQGNTVRSILSMQVGKAEHFHMLVFNLTGIHPEEEILEGRLHIFKRRQPKGRRRRTASSFRLKLLELGSAFEPQFINIVPSKKAGWSFYNVTQTVIKCRSVKKVEDYLLGVTAEIQRHNGRYRTVSLKRIIRLSSQPFLIIFSEDKNRSIVKDESEVITSNEGLDISAFNLSGKINLSPSLDSILSSRNKRSMTVTHVVSYKDIITNPVHRTKRSVFSNNVPDDTLLDRKLTAKDQVTIKYAKKIDPNIIPLPHANEARPFRRRRKKRKHRKLPFWWLKYDSKHRVHNIKQICQKKTMQVDFAGIGWSEWVISPNSYDASYCSGRCSFPLIKNGSPSNHAIIQSLVHTWNRNVLIPAPCCVPSSTSSLTLLYIDENKNVVLKNYPNMVVESCACK